MAHRPPLNDIVGDFSDPSTVRLYRVIINDDNPVLSHRIPIQHKSLQQDYHNALSQLTTLCPNASLEPAYYMIQLLDCNSSSSSSSSSDDYNNNNWLFISYVPDDTHPQLKMRYAYSQNTIKKNLLANLKFIDSLFASTWDEITYKGYQTHLTSQNVSALTLEEKERASLDKESAQMATNFTPIGLPGITTSNRHSSMNTISPTSNPTFPIDDLAKSSVESELTVGGYVVLTVTKEIITHYCTLTPSQPLIPKLPKDIPLFIVSRINSSTLVMIYCCVEGTRVKDRMIASSARPSVISWLESLSPKFQLGKRYEVSELNDIPSLVDMRTECGLNSDGDPIPSSTNPNNATDTVLPSKVMGTTNVQSFSRPRPPGRPRGVV